MVLLWFWPGTFDFFSFFGFLRVWVSLAISTTEHMHTEEYGQFSHTATHTALHIYTKIQSRGTHPCVLFIWLSKECWRNIYAKVCLFRVCGSVYIKTCTYCAHLCRCIDVRVSLHVLPLIKVCKHVHICFSMLSTHTLLFTCKSFPELHILVFYVCQYMCVHM